MHRQESGLAPGQIEFRCFQQRALPIIFVMKGLYQRSDVWSNALNAKLQATQRKSQRLQGTLVGDPLGLTPFLPCVYNLAHFRVVCREDNPCLELWSHWFLPLWEQWVFLQVHRREQVRRPPQAPRATQAIPAQAIRVALKLSLPACRDRELNCWLGVPHST